MKIQTLPKQLIFISALLFGNISVGFSQQTEVNGYVIVNEGKTNDIKPYLATLEQIDLDYLREKDKRKNIRFESGFEISLLSLIELQNGATKKEDIDPISTITNFIMNGSGQIAAKAPLLTPSLSKSIVQKASITNTYGGRPADFPEYIDTGNLNKDQKAYLEAKKNWIIKNPGAYKELFYEDKRQQHVSKKEFAGMTKEKKIIIRNNPTKYIIEK